MHLPHIDSRYDGNFYPSAKQPVDFSVALILFEYLHPDLVSDKQVGASLHTVGGHSTAFLWVHGALGGCKRHSDIAVLDADHDGVSRLQCTDLV